MQIQALKALAIVRMNKIEECLPICDEVLASKPTDLDTLNVMMLVLRALGRHSDLVTMYDEAYKAQPGNEELGAQDFFANVRTGNWKAAQQIAQRLFKSFGGIGGDRYLYWSVLSAMLQANDVSTPPTMRPVLQRLAHRLLEGAKIPPHASADRLHVHLTVLKTLGMHDDAAALVDTEEGKAVAKTSLIVDEVRRELVQARRDFPAEGKRATQKIEEGDRNWLEFLAVVEAQFVDPNEAKISDARQFFRKTAVADDRRDRGAWLALLELERRAREQNLGSDFEAENGLMGLLKLYFELFADKLCCFEDLKPYLSTSDLQRSINIYKLKRYLLAPEQLTAEQETAHALAYLRAYTAALPLGKELPSTELQPADDLVLLAAQAFVNSWKISGARKSVYEAKKRKLISIYTASIGKINWLYTAVSVLEYAAQHSKNSYLIRLHLVRLHQLLSAPALALQHYRAMRIKQMQSDTLSHFLLARASTYSLAASGDLTLTTECVEASNIYASNSQDTSEFIVRAFAQEKYSQANLIEFEERLDNSLQRDLVKIEHVRMRLAHEGLSQDLVDMELIELKFIFDRTHHDNRDFGVLPNYQPRGQPTFSDQTLLINSPGLGWLRTFLRIYIRVFLLASDIDDVVEEKLLIGDRPKVADTAESKVPLKDRLPERKEEELGSLSSDERALFDYVSGLCDWLSPYHDHARPPPETVLAEATKAQELQRNGKAAVASNSASKGAHASPNGSPSPPTNGQKKVSEEPLPVKEAPEIVVGHFDALAARFKEVTAVKHLPWEALHVATLAQEAALLLALLSQRFKTPAVVKQNKLGALTASLRSLRQNSVSVLKDMAAELSEMGAHEGTVEARRAFVDACNPIQQLPEFDNDTLLDVAKRVCDSRKRVLEGVAKGITKITTNHLQ
ncbi:actin cytoskeleton organization protein [Sanghuangporus baumii]|uniref:Actin cytoskeleton organization protein n=1 Tax=Sanghuangporus baumii TaxID=108892 RepID=A0A9Q5I616_SANBA|nr:actin cytoskeleton organization protein [Sanghuangporus baumii]